MTHPIGRLALRVEGDEWVAYYAVLETMDGAIRLASIQVKLVKIVDRKEAFMKLMTDVVADIIEDATGHRPVWPHGPEPAPEHERAGRT